MEIQVKSGCPLCGGKLLKTSQTIEGGRGKRGMVEVRFYCSGICTAHVMVSEADLGALAYLQTSEKEFRASIGGFQFTD